MTCADARDLVLAHARGALPPGDDAAVREHLASCAACARVDHVDRMLSEVLEQRLPQHPASLALKRRLAAEWPAPPRARTSFKRFVMPALAAAAVVLALTPQLYQRLVVVPGERNALVTEAVNDHVRVLLSQRPMDVESSDVHQVKPWFAGRLDFAPAVAFDGDAEFPLRGGAVGYFLDRRAAGFLYPRRLHTISLFVVPADGLHWPERRLEMSSRGFRVIPWRARSCAPPVNAGGDPGRAGRARARAGAPAAAVTAPRPLWTSLTRLPVPDGPTYMCRVPMMARYGVIVASVA